MPYIPDPEIRSMIAAILSQVFVHKALTIPEACFAAGKGSYGNRAMKLAHNCYIHLGTSRAFEAALNHLLESGQLVLRYADARLYESESAPPLPLVSKALDYARPSWLPVALTLP